MSFQMYSSYKDADFVGLDQVPSHWDILRFKQVFEEINERSATGEEELLSVSEYYGVKPRSQKIEEGEHLSRADSLEGYKLCNEGDLVMNIMLAWKRGLGVTDYRGIVSPAYAVFRLVRDALPYYYHYLLRSDEYIGYFKTFSSGVIDSRLRLYPEVFGRLTAIVPPVDEQTQIARFLDHETAKVDALIREQERLIELLQEKRQAVISHAVTKGLDPDVPMKDSGVEWLGEVPAHWTIRKGSYIGRLFGSDPVPESMVLEEGRIPFLKVASLSASNIDVASWDWFVSSEYQGALRPAKNFIVFPKRGAAIFLNKVNVVNRKAVIDPNLMGWEISGGHVTEFYAHVLKCRGLSELADVSTVPQINNKHVAPEMFPVPPVEEQRGIVRYLETRIQEMERLNESAKKSIELLKERRSALISAAVTGKIDVRNWQPPTDESAFDEDVRQAGMETTA